MSLDDIRFHLTPDKENEQGFVLPEKASDWAALTDDELFRLRRKVERDNVWKVAARIENELTTRLIQALSALRQSSDEVAGRLTWLTWVLVFLTVVIAAFTVALFFKG